MNFNVHKTLVLIVDQDTEIIRKSLSTFEENTRESLKSIILFYVEINIFVFNYILFKIINTHTHTHTHTHTLIHVTQ